MPSFIGRYICQPRSKGVGRTPITPRGLERYIITLLSLWPIAADIVVAAVVVEGEIVAV